jgi:hypothetical protein
MSKETIIWISGLIFGSVITFLISINLPRRGTKGNPIILYRTDTTKSIDYREYEVYYKRDAGSWAALNITAWDNLIREKDSIIKHLRDTVHVIYSVDGNLRTSKALPD